MLAIQISAIAQDIAENNRIVLKGTPTSIIPPKHFEYDSLTNRLLHPGTMSQIRITKIANRSYKAIAEAMTDEYITAQGYEPLGKQEYKMESGADAIIFRNRIKSHDDKGNEMYFIRLMLFSGDKNTIWITADFPECLSKQIEEPIMESMLSTKDQQE